MSFGAVSPKAYAAPETSTQLPSYRSFPVGRAQVLKFSGSGDLKFPHLKFPLFDIIQGARQRRNGDPNVLDVLAQCLETCEQYAVEREDTGEALEPDDVTRQFVFHKLQRELMHRLNIKESEIPLLAKVLTEEADRFSHPESQLTIDLNLFEEEHKRISIDLADISRHVARHGLDVPYDTVDDYVEGFVKALMRTSRVDGERTEMLVRGYAGNLALAEDTFVEPSTETALVPVRQSRRAYQENGSFENLNNYAEDLIASAEKDRLPRAYLRHEKLNEVIQILSMPDSNRSNVLISGDAGTGKTYMINELANMIANGDVPDNLREAQMFALDLGALMAGTTLRGQYEERVQEVIADIGFYLRSDPHNKFILYIDEAHVLKTFGKGSSQTLLDTMKVNLMERYGDQLSVICTSTPRDMREYKLDQDETFNRRFQTVDLPQFTYDQVQAIIGKRASDLYDRTGVEMAPSVLQAILDAGQEVNRIKGKALLSAAMDIMDLAVAVAKGLPSAYYRLQDEEEQLKLRRQSLAQTLATEAGKEEAWDPQYTREFANIDTKLEETKRAMVRMKREFIESGRGSKAKIEAKHVTEALRVVSGNPFLDMGDDRIERILNAAEELGDLVKGQDDALDVVGEALFPLAKKQGRPTSKDAEQPLASMLLVGPTAVGKSLTAKAIADKYFYGNLINLSMTEYQEKSSVNMITGAKPGYIGFNGTETLVNRVRKNPYSVILFDEVEKAHPEVKQLLLQILGEGRLTDSSGQVADFSNCLIVMTSNLQQRELRAMMSERKTKQAEKGDALSLLEDDAFEVEVRKLMSSSPEGFTEEQMRRVDYVIPYSFLTTGAVETILENVIRDFNEEVEERYKRGMTVELTDRAKEQILTRSGRRVVDVSKRGIGFNAKEPEKMLQSGADDVVKVFKRTAGRAVDRRLVDERNDMEPLTYATLKVDYDSSAAKVQDRWTVEVIPTDQPAYQKTHVRHLRLLTTDRTEPEEDGQS